MTSRTQPVTTATGQRYGEAGEQAAAQSVIPLPDTTSGPVSGGASPQGAPVARPNMFGATERPNEPLTAGAAEGPGPGQKGMLPDDPFELIRAVVLQGYDRTGALRRLLERASK